MSPPPFLMEATACPTDLQTSVPFSSWENYPTSPRRASLPVAAAPTFALLAAAAAAVAAAAAAAEGAVAAAAAAAAAAG
eukprot:CAMPEP_0202348098 /NCGR_PEP_ID=MMETSP1126-20121109/6176_1 /ASSEMBLY_ACC=CAM_ASM_000457 /TAXON_ID=3047 /ORGANISM="Dunaliella tertiolecta, Strain CCMP1320" /LENGTH=78 /DNA_ID=CAMNT_0048939741 /DNA_START=349 /DNA_END=580 /DNA_ORIENTATION=-